MSYFVTFNGQTYTLPSVGDSGWGDQVNAYYTAISTGTLQKNSTNFDLLNELSFGNSYGVKTLYVKTQTSNPATTGVLRLANTDVISWRNGANDGNLNLSVSGDDLYFNGSLINPDLSSFLSVPLTTEADFGTTAGIKVKYLASTYNNHPNSGFIRLCNGEVINWRNDSNTGDIPLYLNGNDLYFSGNAVKVGAIDAAEVNYSLTAGPAGTLLDSLYGLIATRTSLEVAAGVTPTNYFYPPGNVMRYGADPTGVADSTTAITNAIATGHNTTFPAGDFKTTAPIIIDESLWFDGSGSCAADDDASGNPGPNTTRILYTGTTGNALEIVGSGTEGKENLRVSNMSVWGNSSCDGGMYVGSDVALRYCTFKNLHFKNFTNTASVDVGYGVRLGHIIDSYFENVYCQANQNGWLFNSLSTSLRFIGCTSRVNLKWGYYISYLVSSTFIEPIAEGNGYGALRLDPGNGQEVSNNTWYSLYTEANCQSASDDVLSFTKSGTGSNINNTFYSPKIYESLGGNVNGYFGYGAVTDICIYDAELGTVVSGFAHASGSTSGCYIQGRQFVNTPQTNVTGNTYDPSTRRYNVQLNAPGEICEEQGTWTPTVESGGTASSFFDSKYVRIGNKVTVYSGVNLTNLTTALNIGGLPFTPGFRAGFGNFSKVSSAVNNSMFVDTDSTIYYYFDSTYTGGDVSAYFSAEYLIG